MGLDVYLTKLMPTNVFEAYVTHNLGVMASEAGIYMELWWPEEIGTAKAEQLIRPLEQGLAKLKAEPERFKKFNPSNGWGSYDDFIPWVERYLEACREHPDADIIVSR